MNRPRVVIAGLGDTGLLTATHLAKHVDVVGISSKPGLVSGQELGHRLAWPERWTRDYWIDHDRFRALRDSRVVHGSVVGVDPVARTLHVQTFTGDIARESYDVLVISTGVRNGFWRTPELQDNDQIAQDLESRHRRLAAAGSIAVIGGGAAAVSSAFNIARRWTDASVDLFHPGDRPLPAHHRRAWRRIEQHLTEAGVGLHPGHRAVIPEDFECDDITRGPVEWQTGQPATEADAVLWAVGKVQPNTDWLPLEWLDEDGFVRVDPDLRLPGHKAIFAVGDVAATDPLRSSARNRADKLMAHNIRASLDGNTLRSFKAPRKRWGSIIGIQDNGLEVFTASGHLMRFPHWTIDTVLQPLIVRQGIYGGVRRP